METAKTKVNELKMMGYVGKVALDQKIEEYPNAKALKEQSSQALGSATSALTNVSSSFLGYTKGWYGQVRSFAYDDPPEEEKKQSDTKAPEPNETPGQVTPEILLLGSKSKEEGPIVMASFQDDDDDDYQKI